MSAKRPVKNVAHSQAKLCFRRESRLGTLGETWNQNIKNRYKRLWDVWINYYYEHLNQALKGNLGGNTKLVAHFDSIVVISPVLERGSKAGVDFFRGDKEKL